MFDIHLKTTSLQNYKTEIELIIRQVMHDMQLADNNET
jgi:hypothetical protein